MIGERLKELRTARNLSLRDLAAQAGVSATLLSQVERSVTDPSLETVRRLAAVFGESITSLFAEPNAPAVWISRPGNRSKLTAPAGRVSYERLTAGQSDLEVLRAVLAPGQVSADEPRGHPSTECVYVIQGNWWRRSRASTIWSRAARASPSTRGSRTATATTHPGRWRSSCPSRRPVPESPPRASAASAGQTQPCSSFTLSWSNAVQTNPLGILRLDHVSWTVRNWSPSSPSMSACSAPPCSTGSVRLTARRCLARRTGATGPTLILASKAPGSSLRCWRCRAAPG